MLYTNTKMICNTKVDSNTLPIIHGLQFWAMDWRIMLHSIMFSLDYTSKLIKTFMNYHIHFFFKLNKEIILHIQIINHGCCDFLTDCFPQLITIALLAVDFYLSGFLLVYWYLKRLANKQKSNYKTKLQELFIFLVYIH